MADHLELTKSELIEDSSSRAAQSNFRDQAFDFTEQNRAGLFLGVALAAGAAGAVAIRALGRIGAELAADAGAEATATALDSVPKLELDAKSFWEGYSSKEPPGFNRLVPSDGSNVAVDMSGRNAEGAYVQGHGPGNKYFYLANGHETSFPENDAFWRKPADPFGNVGAENESYGDVMTFLRGSPEPKSGFSSFVDAAKLRLESITSKLKF